MMINLFQPTTGNEELQALSHTLSTNWLGKGTKVTEFEAAWADHVGVNPANMVSTNSCTSALFEAVRLAGLKPGDEVIIPTIHFVGGAQAVLAAGAIPVFCDVDRWTMNATHDAIYERLSSKTRAVIMNHYGGVLAPAAPDDLDDLIWIHDLANAPMAKIASLGFCDFATWSFDAMKIITTGDGGMLYCASGIDAAEARMSFCLGVSSESGVSSQKDSRWWEFSIVQPGMRRELMNDLQAAMGLEQLKKLPEFVARRLEIVRQYEKVFGRYLIGDDLPYYFYWIDCSLRDELAQFLRKQGIYTSFRYWPLHWAYGWRAGQMPWGGAVPDLPHASYAANFALNLPLHQSLTDEEVATICDTIQAFMDVNFGKLHA